MSRAAYEQTLSDFYKTRERFNEARTCYYSLPIWNLPRRWRVSGEMLRISEEMERLADRLEAEAALL